MSFLDRLNPEQRQAAEHFEGPLLVLAGAGSGKTRVLTSRIAHLIEDYGVAPDSILSLTFTNKAAGEMRERVRDLLGREPAGMWIGTFHSIGARMLRRDAPRLGWAPNFLIYDADDSERLTRRILKDELGYDPKRWSPRAVRGAISSAKNELVGVEEFTGRALDPFSRVVAEVYERYQKALRDANAFDFDDLLVKPVQALQHFPDLLARYRERFNFLLVDEYQDTNRAQYEFLKLLAARENPDDEQGGQGRGGNLFVVGDDDQSIYGWRGADVRNILDFEKDFPDADVIRLEENYRSTQRILEVANRVIEENVNRKGKVLRTSRDVGEMITLTEAADEADEADWIATSVLGLLNENSDRGLRDFVVLYRTNAQSRALEEAFLRERIPYRVVGGQRFYERREVKDVLAYLRLMANPADDEAFLRVASRTRGIGDTSLARLAEMARDQGVPLLEAAREAEDAAEIRGTASRALPGLAALLAKYAALASLDIRLDKLMRQLIEEIRLEEDLRREGSEGEDRIANVEELIASAAELQARLEDEDPALMEDLAGMEEELRPIDLFLSHVALITDIDQQDPDADVTSLMTLHNAKGLEFPVVFISGLEEGLFPLSQTMDEPEQLEEERRLFYVGITRAQEKLFLSTARRRRRGGEWKDSIASSFLESVPNDHLDSQQTTRVQVASRSHYGFGRGGRSSRRRDRIGLTPTSPPPSPSGRVVDYSDTQDHVRLIKGARVRHPQFGGGTVLGVSGFGADVRAAIDFDSVGRKQVVVRYANLQNDWD